MKSALRSILLSVLLFLGYLLAVGASIDDAKRVGVDEYGWLVVSDETLDLLRSERRFDSEAWHEGFLVRPWGSMNPNLGKVILGLALWTSGYDRPPPDFFPADGRRPSKWGRLNWEEREASGAAHRSDITRLRFLLLAFGGASAVLLFFLGRAMGGSAFGFLAFAGYALAPAVSDMAFVVYTDNLLQFFSLLAFLATLVFVRWRLGERSRGAAGRTIAAALLLGVVYSLPVGVKANGALIPIVAAVTCAALWAGGFFRHHRWFANAALFGGVGLLAVTLFVAQNPQLFDDVPARISWMMEKWETLLTRQQGHHPELALETVSEQILMGTTRGLAGGGLFARLHWAPGALLSAVGLVLVAIRVAAVRKVPERVLGPLFLLVYALVVGVGTILWLPLDWTRYYLPLIPIGSLLQAWALVEGGRRLLLLRRVREAG